MRNEAHSLDEKCVCRICGEEKHDFEVIENITTSEYTHTVGSNQAEVTSYATGICKKKCRKCGKTTQENGQFWGD